MSALAEKIIKKAEEKFYEFVAEHRRMLGRCRGLVIQIQEKDSRMTMTSVVLGSFQIRTDLITPHDVHELTRAKACSAQYIAELMCSNNCTTYTTQSREGGGIATAFFYASAFGFPSDLAHLFLFQVLRECEALHGNEGAILLEFETYSKKFDLIKS